MRLHLLDKSGVGKESARLAQPDLFDAVPTRGRSRTVILPDGWVWLAARLLGALAVLATGAVHLYEFEHFYSSIPTIGTLFVLNFLGATAIGLGLLAPLERITRRYGSTLLSLLALAGIALAAIAFAFLEISEHTPLFGFQEPGYDPAGIAAARGAEIATVLFLGLFLLGRLRPTAPARRSSPPRQPKEAPNETTANTGHDRRGSRRTRRLRR